jgi:hypothetical protein
VHGPAVAFHPGFWIHPFLDPIAPASSAFTIVFIQPTAAFNLSGRTLLPFCQLGDIRLFLLQPFFESAPLPEEAFMADIDHVGIIKRSVPGWQKKADIIGAKGLDHRQHMLSFLFTDHFHELLQSLWTTHFLAISLLDQREEHLSSNDLLMW